MSRRDSDYERMPRDLYQTPGWVTEVLGPHLPNYIWTIWEPAAGAGQMVDVIVNWEGVDVIASDIEPLDRARVLRGDFLNPAWSIGYDFDAIVTNPPYKLATEFCIEALRRTKEKRGVVAMLLSVDFDSAKTRLHLFRNCPAWSKKIVLTRRIQWFEPPAPKPGKKKSGPSENHAWYLWDWQHEGPPTIAYGPDDERRVAKDDARQLLLAGVA